MRVAGCMRTGAAAAAGLADEHSTLSLQTVVEQYSCILGLKFAELVNGKDHGQLLEIAAVPWGPVSPSNPDLSSQTQP